MKNDGCYIDDIAVKSHDKRNHLDDLRTMFDIMQNQQLKMNLTKLFFGASSVKFLGFIITSKGIHLDADKVKVIQSMQSLKPSKSLEVYKVDLPISEDSFQISWVTVNRLHG